MSDRPEGRPPGAGGGAPGAGGGGGMPAGLPPGGFVDPFQVWKSWYEASEQALARSLEQMVGTQEYAQAMGRTMEAFLAFQRTVRDNMKLLLESVNLPTRDDIARVAEQVVNLEGKIDDLDDRIDELAGGSRSTPAEAGTTIAALEQRLATIEATLHRLESGGPQPVRAELAEITRRLDAVIAALGTTAGASGAAAASSSGHGGRATGGRRGGGAAGGGAAETAAGRGTSPATGEGEPARGA